MFLVVVDTYSKWPFVSIMQSKTVEKTIDELRQWFATYDIPKQVICVQILCDIHEDEWDTSHRQCALSSCYKWISGTICTVTETWPEG
jgi:hypothetical protein